MPSRRGDGVRDGIGTCEALEAAGQLVFRIDSLDRTRIGARSAVDTGLRDRCRAFPRLHLYVTTKAMAEVLTFVASQVFRPAWSGSWDDGGFRLRRLDILSLNEYGCPRECGSSGGDRVERSGHLLCQGHLVHPERGRHWYSLAAVRHRIRSGERDRFPAVVRGELHHRILPPRRWGAPNARQGWWELQPVRNNQPYNGFHRAALPEMLAEVSGAADIRHGG